MRGSTVAFFFLFFFLMVAVRAQCMQLIITSNKNFILIIIGMKKGQKQDRGISTSPIH